MKSELVATAKDPFLSSIFTFADDGAVSVSPSHLARLATTYADDPEGYRQAKLSAENSAAQLQNKMQTLLRSIDVATQMYDWQVENALLGVSDAQRPFVPRVPPRPPKPSGQYEEANKAGAGPEDYNSKDVPFLEGPDLQIMRQSLKILLATADTPVSEELLDHYFGNSGKPYEMNVDAIYRDVPGFGAHATRSAEAAAAEARTYMPAGYTGPVAFSTDYGSTVGDQEQTYQISKDENFDYWGALHNISYATTGVSYSSPGGGQTLDYQTSIYDYYNFEPGTDIFPPLDITDQRFINNYHLYGWAQNYDVTGTSSTRHSTGG
ncbi:hypothetical protein QSJ19_25960 [Gordonia sp. ABSL11-1]|uniref:hypothetical protein n=1 Tax=Gordonia sp. ABSL11-1 TaxID=3053924 RepID=UPI002572D908|nr:hypothetical protein [Gordonia sp. ABSL11-1]MDL9948962.1 hypothetical protein [Gordonia sp. ABSL11-1]